MGDLHGLVGDEAAASLHRYFDSLSVPLEPGTKDYDAALVLADRDRLAATVERVRALCDRWERTRVLANTSAALTRVDELRAALDAEEARGA